jgi:hypothetical protein
VTGRIAIEGRMNGGLTMFDADVVDSEGEYRVSAVIIEVVLTRKRAD